jgi:hypothetical protein
MLLENKPKEEANYKRIIIELDKKISSIYPLSIYNNYPFLKKYITKEEFNKIIDNVNIIIYDSKIKKEKFDTIKISFETYALFLLSLILTIGHLILFYYAPRNRKNQILLKVFGIIFLFLACSVLIFIEFFHISRTIQGEKSLYEFYVNDVKKYLEKVNRIWKDKLIFYYDEKTKNIICYIYVLKILNKNKKPEETGSNNSKSSNKDNKNLIDTATYQTEKTSSISDLYSNKSDGS